MAKLSKSTKAEVQKELNRVAMQMALTSDPDELAKLEQKYGILSDVLKPQLVISPDTIAIVSANLLGILLILNYERLDIVSTKALGFVLKGRV